MLKWFIKKWARVEVERIVRIEIDDGDILVIEHPAMLSEAGSEHIHELLGRFGLRAVVLEAGMQLSAVLRRVPKATLLLALLWSCTPGKLFGPLPVVDCQWDAETERYECVEVRGG